VGRGFFAGICVVQAVAGIAWAAWTVLSQEGLQRYVALLPSVVLLLGAVAALLAARAVSKSAGVAAELQRIKTMNRLDMDTVSAQERLQHFATLKQWGLITEEEFAQKRRALLGLEEVAPVKDDASPAAEATSMRAPTLPTDRGAGARDSAARAYPNSASKKTRKPAARH